MSDTETSVAIAGKGDAVTCFHPEHEEDLALHTALTTIDAQQLAFLRPAVDDGDAGNCFHPEMAVTDKGDAGTCFHPEMAVTDNGEAGGCFHPEMALADNGDAGGCFHPEHEGGLALHTDLTTIDAQELAFLRAAR